MRIRLSTRARCSKVVGDVVGCACECAPLTRGGVGCKGGKEDEEDKNADETGKERVVAVPFENGVTEAVRDGVRANGVSVLCAESDADDRLKSGTDGWTICVSCTLRTELESVR
jgi:hypothetical protein